MPFDVVHPTHPSPYTQNDLDQFYTDKQALWQAEADTELTLSASPTTAVGQKALFHGNEKRYRIPFIK